MKINAFLLLVMAGLLFSCSSSKLTTSWKATDASARYYKKILVLGLLRDEDRDTREKIENHMVGDLNDRGFKAVASHDEFTPKDFEGMNEKQALQKLNTGGYDAVITIVLLNKAKERYYVPGRVYYSPYYVHQGHFWGYSRTMYDRIYSPGYYSVETKYFWESNLYDLTTRELLYSAQTQSFDPASSESLGHEYSLLIVQDILKKNLLTTVEPQTAPAVPAVKSF